MCPQYMYHPLCPMSKMQNHKHAELNCHETGQWAEPRYNNMLALSRNGSSQFLVRDDIVKFSTPASY